MDSLTLEEHGVEIKPGLISETMINSIIHEVDSSDNSNSKHGIRNADKKFKSIMQTIGSGLLLAEAKRILQHTPSIVRVIFFDKTPEKNWLVTWHQDKTVAVNKKFDSIDWGPWSVKDGIHHVQPPLEVLNNMVTFRLHLDRADEKNGCLKIIPGSHIPGFLSPEKIQKLVAENTPIPCIAEAGDTVIMRPLILHSSSKAECQRHRRVVHVEFSGYKLPDEIFWA